MKRNIRAGTLRERFVLGRPIVAQDGTGAELVAWEERMLWGYREPLSGKEWAAQAMLKDSADNLITIRWVPRDGTTPTPRCRLLEVESGNVYEITSVMVNPEHSVVELMCRTGMGPRDGR
jgi:head-tail adaptor